MNRKEKQTNKQLKKKLLQWMQLHFVSTRLCCAFKTKERIYCMGLVFFMEGVEAIVYNLILLYVCVFLMT